MHVLVVNSGSSSIKFRLYDMAQERLLVSGILGRIGDSNSSSAYREYTASGDIKVHQQNSTIGNHKDGLTQIFDFLDNCNSIDSITSLQAIGHRVVHGGEKYQSPTLIDNDVIHGIRAMNPLAPLHNPANLTAIEALRQLYPQLPQVAVFDTAFFRTLPAHAYRYALPNDLYQQHHVRRYGFHGTSHQYVSRQAADYLQRPLQTLSLITLHLGNGVSAAAIDGGNCIDTSMGMTPLEGLIMGTRCGDIDPSIHGYLSRTLGMDLDEIENLLNHDSGLKGLCGISDMREVHQLAHDGDKQAQLAIEMYCYRIIKYIGAYYAALGGLDAMVFTAGVGENDSVIRQIICDRLSVFGIRLDLKRNQNAANATIDIGGQNSKVRILVIPTNEELEIAHQTIAVINKSSPT